MKIAIAPKRYKTQNCIENCIANYCDASDIDFRPLFLYSWDLGYDRLRETIGERIHYHYSCSMDLDNYLYLMASFLNIPWERYVNNTDLIKEKCKAGAFFMIGMDSFNCPWTHAYQKHHYPHYFLLFSVGGNQQDGYIVIDSYSKSESVAFDENLFKYIQESFLIGHQIDETNKLHYYEKVLNKKNLSEKIRREFSNHLSTNLMVGKVNLLKAFCVDLRQINSLEQLSPFTKDIADAMIIRRLTYLANSRYNAAILMSYLNFAENDIIKLKTLFEKWDAIKNYFIKILITKKIKLLIITSEMIADIASNELAAMEAIRNSIIL